MTSLGNSQPRGLLAIAYNNMCLFCILYFVFVMCFLVSSYVVKG